MNDTKLQLEAGKHYRTRDGRKAFVADICPEDIKVAWPAMGWIRGSSNKKGEQVLWRRDGTDYGDNDLVAEWVEPKRIKGKLYFLECSKDNKALHPIFLSAEQGDTVLAHGSLKTVACIEIDCEEGAGL